MEPQPPRPLPPDPPAWPLGCVLAGLALVLLVNLMAGVGLLLAAAGVPRWLEVASIVAIAAALPLAMLAGGRAARRRNPYGARVLLWGALLTLALGAALTLIFNLVDRLNGVG